MNWTSRNTVNVVIAAFLAGVIIYVNFFDPSQRDIQSFSIAALAGLIIPGSPIGRGIDALLTTRPGPNDPEGGWVDPMIFVWVLGFFSTISAALLLLSRAN